MNDNSRLLISLGFLLILGLTFTVVSVSLFQLQSSTESMARLVEATTLKTAAASDMRDAMRQRGDSLKAMRLAKDIYKRDEEYRRLLQQAGKYHTARDTLVSQGIDAREGGVLDKLTELAGTLPPYHGSSVEPLINDKPGADVAPVFNLTWDYQDQIFEQLDKLVTLEQENAQHTLVVNRGHYRGIRQLLYTLAGITLVFSILIAWIVIQRVSAKNLKTSSQASRDVLTGLLNRREFEIRLARSISNAREQSTSHALLYLDIDRFKDVNDNCGKHGGDELLRQLGLLLLSSVRQRDTLGRLGGDEFGMLLENCPLEKSIEIARGLQTAIQSFHFTWGNNTFTPVVSLGLVPIDRSTGDLASAMSAANTACNSASITGRDRIQVAYPGNRRHRKRFGQIQWAARLSTALEEDRFTLFFQQIVPCASKKRSGKHLEILLRMIDDDGTILAPGTFLPAAAKYNLMRRIDRWVIRQSLTWLAQISTPGHSPLMISINLSGQSVDDPSMHKYITELVDETGISAEQVCFEITETAAVSNIIAVTGFMLSLRNRGFRFSLDDVGSGLSSFAYLRKLPVDYLKIDGAFIRDIMSDPVDRAMVRAINELGQLLGKETIAKFVETINQAEELKKLGIQYIQGHACSRPQPLEEFVHTTAPRLVVVSS